MCHLLVCNAEPTKNFWLRFLVLPEIYWYSQEPRIRPELPGSVPGSGFGSWFLIFPNSWEAFGSWFFKLVIFFVPGRLLVNLVSFVP